MTALLRFVVIILMTYLLYACANIVAPSGGPKDVTPPVIIRSTPENYAVNFDKKSVRIFFDEYVRFNNLNSQLMISPPLYPLPEFSVKGKSIIINLPDSLAANTTYNIFFGDAIVDITEGNAIKNFSFVFSTGSYLDSMFVKGKVLDAFTHEPMDNVFVMLYDSISDSIPYLKIPSYLTKTDKNGEFKLNNLRNIEYKIFALKDANNNFIYDLPNEKIAFLDSIIKPDFPLPKITGKDTISTTDSIQTDTAAVLFTFPEPNFYTLFMFQEMDSTQMVLRKTLESRGLVSITFNFPVQDISIKYSNISDTAGIILEEFNKTKDTLKIWILSPDLDSLKAKILLRDTVLDSLSLSVVPRVGRRAIKESLFLKPNFSNNVSFDFFRKPIIEFSAPVKIWHTDSIIFMEDSIRVFPEYVFTDTLTKRRLEINHPLKEKQKYSLHIPDSIFFDYHNITNDSIKFSFTTKSIEDYGVLILNIKIPESNYTYIIELLDEKNNIIRKESISKDKSFKYEKLDPGKYTLKAIRDDNNNNRWDTGDYLEKKQAEKVFINKTEINIRANWDTEIEWQIE